MHKEKTSDFRLIAALCGMLAAAVGVCMNSMGIFYSPVCADLGVKQGTFALYTTISTFAAGLVQMFVPNIMGEHSFKKFMTAGVLAAALASIGMGFASSVIHFYLLAVLMGTGCACFSNVVVTSIINKSITKNVGSVTGLVLSFSGVAGAVCSPFLASVISRFGWRTAYILMGIMILVFCLPAIFTPIHYERSVKAKTQKGAVKVSFQLTAMAVVLFCSMNIITAFPQHFVGLASTKGLDSSVGSLMISAGMIGNICFKLATGWLSDRIGVANSAMCMLGISALGTLLLRFMGEGMLLVGSAFLYGAVYSIAAVSSVLIVKAMFGAENYTSVFSVISFIGVIVYASALSLIGYAYDFTASYNIILHLIIGLDVIGFILLNILNRTVFRKQN